MSQQILMRKVILFLAAIFKYVFMPINVLYGLKVSYEFSVHFIFSTTSITQGAFSVLDFSMPSLIMLINLTGHRDFAK